MRHQMKKAISWLLGILVILIVVCATFIIGTYALAKRDFIIKDENSFVNAVKHSMENKNRSSYVITNNFDLHSSVIPDNADFYGVLDGGCHTITIISDSETDNGGTWTKPIFKTIKAGAEVLRLNLMINEVIVGTNTNDNISVLALQNEGTIKDCCLNVNNIYIGGNCKNAAALVNFNTNYISNIIVTVRNVTYDATRVGWQCRFGAVASINYSKVENIFADVTFSSNSDGPLCQPLFDYESKNSYIGYVFGSLPNNAPQQVKDIYVFNAEYTSRVIDSNVVEHKQYEIIDNKFLENKWSSDWKLEKNGEFPVLFVAK